MNVPERSVPAEFDDPLSNYDPPEYGSALEATLAESLVEAMQLTPYAAVPSTIPIREAVSVLYALEVACLLVVDHGKLNGIFTERDVLERVAEQYPKLADQPIGDVMTSEPFVVYANDPAAAALAAIAAAGYRHVPVLDGRAERLVGVLSPRRVFAFMKSKTPGLHAPTPHFQQRS